MNVAVCLSGDPSFLVRELVVVCDVCCGVHGLPFSPRADAYIHKAREEEVL